MTAFERAVVAEYRGARRAQVTTKQPLLLTPFVAHLLTLRSYWRGGVSPGRGPLAYGAQNPRLLRLWAALDAADAEIDR